jgi:hypothetical protein
VSGGRGRFIHCPTVFGVFADEKSRVTEVVCGFQGQAMRVLKPRPSRKPTRVCPSCLVEAR